MATIKKTWVVSLIAVTLIAASATYAFTYVKRGAASYIYGYPLVLMELTRQAMVETAAEPRLAINHFKHNQIFPDHSFRNVVRPNNDTLYSIAWLDLSAEPLVLSVPDTKGRYYVMPFMDAWTNVFATVGKRTSGTEAGHFALTGPNWDGEVPVEIQRISAPTNMVWVIGRIQTNGKSDIRSVAVLQEQFKLASLNDWKKGVANPHEIAVVKSSKSSADPYRQLTNMEAGDFFQLLADLMAEQPAARADASTVRTLEQIGVVPGKVFDIERLDVLDRSLLDLAVKLGHRGLQKALKSERALENGWAVQRDTIGSYGTNYAVRALVAMFGLGALPPAEAAYPNTTVDAQRQPLSGAHRYRLHFAAGETPPVNAFWSLTMYDEQGFLIDNPIQRYALGDRDALHYNGDGSLDIAIQHDNPGGEDSNWLPAPSGVFALTMRLYYPKQRFLDGSWKVPSVERLD